MCTGKSRPSALTIIGPMTERHPPAEAPARALGAGFDAPLLALGVVAVSFSAILIREAHAPSLTVALYRNAIATALLLPVALARHRAELRALDRRQVGLAAASGAMLALYGERLRPRALAGIAVAVAGAAVISGGDVAVSARAAFGDLLALIGAVTAAAYFLIGRNLRRDLSLVPYV